MKKALLIFIMVLLIAGCSTPSMISQEVLSASSVLSGSSSPTSSQISQVISSITSESETTLTGIDLYIKCFNEGKYDVYKLKIGDPIQNANNEFGSGKKDEYGLGAVCYKFKDIVVSYGEGTDTDSNRVIDFDIVGKDITVYGLTTGLSTVEDVKKVFGEPKEACDVGRYSYESFKTFEDSYDEGERYYFIQYSSKDNYCYVNFFFECGILTVISLGMSSGFNNQ